MNRIARRWHLFIWAIAAMNAGWSALYFSSGATGQGVDSLILALWIALAGWLHKRLFLALEENTEMHDQAIAQAVNYRAFERYHVVSHGRPLPEEKETP